VGENFITKLAFQQQVGTRIDAVLWDKIDRIRRAAKTRYGKDPYKKTCSMENFFATWKRGSRRVRKILEKVSDTFIPHNMVKFADNTETVIKCELAGYLNKLWYNNFFSNEMRTFIFKMHNNTLAFNTIVSHFVRGIDRNCTFCDITHNAVEEDENILHLFYTCTISENIRENFFKWITNDQTFTVSRREFFGEFRHNSKFFNDFLTISGILLKKFLWDCKLRKTLPNFLNLQQFYVSEIHTMCKVSGVFGKIKNNCGINFATLGQRFGIHF
jgi:hypothetical protein